jgi:hypothetical protein
MTPECAPALVNKLLICPGKDQCNATPTTLPAGQYRHTRKSRARFDAVAQPTRRDVGQTIWVYCATSDQWPVRMTSG